MNKLFAEIPLSWDMLPFSWAIVAQNFEKMDWFHLKSSLSSWRFLTLEVGPQSYHET